MKKILAYVTSDLQPSLFDVIVAYDAGADEVIPYIFVDEESMKEVVYSATFTRHPEDLHNTAVFIGGHNLKFCEDLLSILLKTQNELPSGRQVSVTMDPDGAFTTASACVVKIKRALKGKLSRLNATVLAGTGPVGQIIAVLLAREGCNVSLTSRTLKRAESACWLLKKDYNVHASPVKAANLHEVKKAVSGSDIVVSAGPEGVMLLPENVWSGLNIKILADVNAVPPYGIECLDPMLDCGSVGEGVLGIGAVTIGTLKMRTHHALVEKLFEEKGIVFDLDKVYRIAEELCK